MQELGAAGLLAAYHDRSDGGLFVTLVEMAFAGNVGLDVDVGGLGDDPVAALFSEEPGAVVAVRAADLDAGLGATFAAARPRGQPAPARPPARAATGS